VHEVVEAFGLLIFEKKGYEADDVIGTLVAAVWPPTSAIGLQTSGVDFSSQTPDFSDQVHTSESRSPKAEVLVVTGDMDTLQLVRDGVKIYTLRKGMNDIVIYDAEEVTKRYGFGPEHVVDYKSLRGDTSDNIPGVPGIGEKTATELIQKFGTVDELYQALADFSSQTSAIGAHEPKSEVPSPKSGSVEELKPSVIKKLIAGKDKAFMSKKLATIKTDVPDLGFSLEACAIKPFDREKILALFQKFEFVSLLKRLPEFGTVPAGLAAAEEKKSAKVSTKKPIAAVKTTFQEITSKNSLTELKKEIIAAGQYAARIITTGDNMFTATMQHIVIMVGAAAYAVPGSLWNDLRDVFENQDVELVGYDLKQLVKTVRIHGGQVKNRLNDIMIASYLLNPGSRSSDLASIVLKLFGKELVVSDAQASLFGVDTRVVAEELGYCLRAADILRKDLLKIDDYGLFQKMEMPLISVLARMELAGICVDTDMLKKISEQAVQEIASISKTIYELTGTEFNIASPVQLREVLFDKLALPIDGVKKGKTGLSTSAESLEKIRDLHPVIPYIELFRELTKLQNTYVDVLPTLINPTTGRIHTTFNQAVAATGRLSSTDPNLQNIPIRTPLGREIRKTFVAAPGLTLLSADYSQIELRVVASLAQDEKMMAIFARDEDIHKATAAAIHGVPLEAVTKEMRYAAKEINFGVLYGMGTYGLSWRAGISFAEAKEFIEKYFREFSGVKEYIDRTLAFTKQEGYCETLFGRRRYIPELTSSNFQVRSAAERMAVNHPIQGTAADIMKMAMIEVSKRLSDFGFRTSAPKLLLQVHDELVVECHPDDVEAVGKLLTTTMESAVTLRVPVKAAKKVGRSWGMME
jgi:DNA polymerase-1